MKASRVGRWRALPGVAAGLGAAALFGAGAPTAKLLLRDLPPIVLSSLLYLGAGLGLSATSVALRILGFGPSPARMRRADLPRLLWIALCGGVIGPLLLLWGLARVSAVAGSLLLNLEVPFTIALAVLVFGEPFGRRESAATALILVGLLALAARGRDGVHVDPAGVLAIVGACASWAIDNNLTQRLSSRDALGVARAKGLLAGTASLLLAVASGASVPAPRTVAVALCVGFASYGLSLVLSVMAMRSLGAARQTALFATAPFVGALVAVPLLGESIGAREAMAALGMALGVGILVLAEHPQLHQHDPLEHEHQHRHDGHHLHEHLVSDPPGEPHRHAHRHGLLRHAHPWTPDAHHQSPREED